MYCKKCGEELADNASFCSRCGSKTEIRKHKNIFIALILSFILTGIGTVYAGNTKKGLMLLALRLICTVITVLIPFIFVLNIVVWIFGIYDAYYETQRANGNPNPNLIRDFQGWDKNSQIIAALFILFILMISVSGALSFFTPSYHYSDTYNTGTSSSGSGSSSVSHSHYGGVDDSPSTIAKRDPDWYYDHYDYGDNDKIDEYLESQGYD